jgi:hypothetical protein
MIVNNYYYLVSSLPDLVLDGGHINQNLRSMFFFAMDEMQEHDFEQVRKLFLYNDIKNTILLYFYKKKRQEDYSTPAYYDEFTFNEYKKDPSCFLPFLTKFYDLKQTGKRQYPQLPETDELTAHFYEDLDGIAEPGFLRDYFHFELNLRNLSCALAFRKNALPIAAKLIPFGTAYELICKNESAADFGLADEFPMMERIIQLNQQASLQELEMYYEKIRWDWLDERVGTNYFSTDAIIAFFVKLLSVERWNKLSKEKGDELFNGLMNTIKRSIRFSIEFITTGEK